MTDQELLARCLWGEARGEGHCGMVAVACVIWNRHIKWNQTIEEVILGPNQFTSMAGSGPNIPAGDPVYPDCLNIAAQVLTGKIADITNGACYYANLAIANSTWFTDQIINNVSQHPVTAKLLHHTFFL